MEAPPGGWRWCSAHLATPVEDSDLLAVDEHLDHLAAQPRRHRVASRAQADGREVVHLPALAGRYRRSLHQAPQPWPLLLQPLGRSHLVSSCTSPFTSWHQISASRLAWSREPNPSSGTSRDFTNLTTAS